MKYRPCQIVHLLIIITVIFSCSSHQTRRTLRVGIYQNMPKVGLDSNNEPAGVFIDIIEYIAQKENWKLEFVQGTWSELLEKLDAGEIDIMVDVARSKEREEKYDFNQLPALTSWMQVYTGKNRNITGLHELSGKTIAVLEGSIQQSYLKKLKYQLDLDYELITFDSYRETIEATEQGVCDILIASRFFAYQRNHSLEPKPVFMRPSTLHYTVSKGSHKDVLSIIDYHLSILMNEEVDTYQGILAENLGGSHIISFPYYVFLIYFVMGILLLAAVIVVIILLLRLKRQSQKVLETERRLHHSDKLKAIGHLAGGVAHDFGNMLTGIRGYAEVMQMDPETVDVEKYARNILEIGNQAGELTQQLLSFARLDTHEKSKSDIHNIAGSVKSLLDHSLSKSIEIKLDLSAERFEMLCLKSQIHSALLNLCINAGDAMPDGGVLEISTRNAKLSSKDFEMMDDYIYADKMKYENGEYLIISVRDTGHGIPQNDIDNIFTPYFTTKETGKGTGLGMTAVLGAVSAHNWVLAMNSKEERGTEVRIFLPLIK